MKGELAAEEDEQDVRYKEEGELGTKDYPCRGEEAEGGSQVIQPRSGRAFFSWE